MYDSMNKLKVLYIIPRLARAGTEKHLINLACGLAKTRFDVSVCCLFDIGDIDKEYNRFDFKLFCLCRRNVYDVRVAFDLYRLLKKERYDIVHTYLFGFHYLAGISAKISKIPVVISSRRSIENWKKRHHLILGKLRNIYSDKVIACSNAVRNFTIKQEKLHPSKIITIYNGTDINKFCPRSKEGRLLTKIHNNSSTLTIGTVANFSEIKDHYTLFKALEIIRREKTFDFKCFLIGSGLLRDRLKKWCKELKLEQHVVFLEKRDDIPELLSEIDVFVLTSKLEGLPNAILEAMACGVPVVSTNGGGVPEVVKHGKSGFLLKSEDSQGIANAIISLLKNDSLRQEMGRCGRRIIEQNFSLGRMIKDYEKFYESLFKTE